MTPNTATKTDRHLAVRVVAVASLGAAVIHFAVIPAHWGEWVPAGMFFASIALFQLFWGLILLGSPRALVLVAGILANLGFGAMWVLSRIKGAPLGPHAGEPEVVQAAGICALLLQCYVVMGAAWLWYRGRRADPLSGLGYRLVFMGAASVIGAAATVGVASGLQPGHHAPAEAERDHHSLPGEEAAHPHGQPAPIAPPGPDPIPGHTEPAHDDSSPHHT